MQSNIRLLIAAIAFLLPATLCSYAPAEEIRVGGESVGFETMITPYTDTFNEETGIGMTVRAMNSIDALIELQKGNLDVVISADSYDYMLTGASIKGVIVDTTKLRKTDLAVSYSRVFTHRDVKVAKLSKEQLKAIFTGKITNWKKLGGDNRKISVVWGKMTTGQNDLFTKLILDGEPVTKARINATDYADIKQKISSTPGSIGINPEDFMNSKTARFPQAPVFIQHVIAVTKAEPAPKVQKMLEFLLEISVSISSYTQKGYF